MLILSDPLMENVDLKYPYRPSEKGLCTHDGDRQVASAPLNSEWRLSGHKMCGSIGN